MKKVNYALAMECALEVLAPVMLISMGTVVSMQYVPIIVANMARAIWKPTAVSVMKDGLVITV